MENLLLNKYKDRSPKDTVALVTEFFEKKGFKIKTNRTDVKQEVM